MITDSDVERALDYLRDNASADAQARANVEYAREWMKVVLAQETVANAGMSNAAATALAMTTVAYRGALDALKEAVAEDSRRRFMREAAAAKIDAWRTQSSNERAGRL